jgi:chorismate dehydratase
MNSSDPIPELRLAPLESADDLAHRVEREQRSANVQRESELENSLAPFRVGSVPYLNAVPLTRGLERQIEFIPPAQLAEKLRRGDLDAALVSITEVLFHDGYDVLDGIAVASLGEVFSVFLAHRVPLEQVTEVLCDTASLTSVNLLRVLLAERGLKPEFKPLPAYAEAGQHDAVLLIGNPAIEFRRTAHSHEIWDLGTAWYELTRLPFVYAIWALRRSKDNERLRRQLREARDFGLDTLDYLISSRPEFDLDFRRDYLGWHIHYHLGADEKRGIARFVELLRKHLPDPVFPPRFVA